MSTALDIRYAVTSDHSCFNVSPYLATIPPGCDWLTVQVPSDAQLFATHEEAVTYINSMQPECEEGFTIWHNNSNHNTYGPNVRPLDPASHVPIDEWWWSSNSSETMKRATPTNKARLEAWKSIFNSRYYLLDRSIPSTYRKRPRPVFSAVPTSSHDPLFSILERAFGRYPYIPFMPDAQNDLEAFCRRHPGYTIASKRDESSNLRLRFDPGIIAKRKANAARRQRKLIEEGDFPYDWLTHIVDSVYAATSKAFTELTAVPFVSVSHYHSGCRPQRGGWDRRSRSAEDAFSSSVHYILCMYRAVPHLRDPKLFPAFRSAVWEDADAKEHLLKLVPYFPGMIARKGRIADLAILLRQELAYIRRLARRKPTPVSPVSQE